MGILVKIGSEVGAPAIHLTIFSVLEVRKHLQQTLDVEGYVATRSRTLSCGDYIVRSEELRTLGQHRISRHHVHLGLILHLSSARKH